MDFNWLAASMVPLGAAAFGAWMYFCYRLSDGEDWGVVLAVGLPVILGLSTVVGFAAA